MNARSLVPIRRSVNAASIAFAISVPEPGSAASSNGTTALASVSSAGVQGNGNSDWGNSPSDRYINGDGRFVAFQPEASNLAAGELGCFSDVFVHDTQLSITEAVCVSSAGVFGNQASNRPSIRDDGRFVAFEPDSTVHVPNDTNGVRDVFVRDRQLGLTSEST